MTADRVIQRSQGKSLTKIGMDGMNRLTALTNGELWIVSKLLETEICHNEWLDTSGIPLISASSTMILNLNWFRSLRRTRRSGVSRPFSLENRTLLAGVTFTVQGATLKVNGTDAANDVITVGINGGGNYEINDDGVLTDTGVATAAITTVILRGMNGNDVLTLDASLGTKAGQVFGLGGDDTIIANNSGANILRGGAGADNYVGGFGKDQAVIDQFDTGGFDQGTTNNDSIVSTDATAGLVLILGAAGIESISGTDFADVIDLTGETVDVVINGKGGNDILVGGAGHDIIYGGAGEDSIFGRDGNDVLRGEAGDDYMDGMGGGDMADFTNATSGVDANLTTGLATGGAGTDTLISFEHLSGSSFGDILTGNGFENTIFGKGGDDVIIGLGAGDRMYGDAGIDTLDYSASTAGVKVSLTLAIQQFGHAEGDRNFGIENVIGSDFNDIIDGGSGANVLTGGLGDDFITGRAGADTLWGNAGNDTLDGDGGADLVDGGADNDTVLADSLDDGSGTFTGGTGIDALKADLDAVAVNWLLVNAGFETISGSNAADTIDLTGSLVGATVNGRNGNDLLTGGDGNDTLNGGNNDDTIFGGLGGDIIRGEAGADTLYANNLANDNDGIRDRLFGGADVDSFFDIVGADPLDTRNDP